MSDVPPRYLFHSHSNLQLQVSTVNFDLFQFAFHAQKLYAAPSPLIFIMVRLLQSRSLSKPDWSQFSIPPF